MTNYASNLSEVLRCQEILGHRFNDQLNCLKALQNSGHALVWENRFLRVPKNDTIAVLGDVIAKAFLCEKWFATGRPKGKWDQIHNRLLSNRSLSRAGKEIGLDECIILNAGTAFISDKMVATAMEALFAAVYLDAGFEALGRVLDNLGITDERLNTIVTWAS